MTIQPEPYRPMPASAYPAPIPQVGEVAIRVKPHHGLAIAGFCCAIIGCIFGMIPLTFFMAFILGALGLIFGLLGRKHALGKWSVALALIAVTLGIIGVVIVNRAVTNFGNDVDCINNATTTSQMDACN